MRLRWPFNRQAEPQPEPQPEPPVPERPDAPFLSARDRRIETALLAGEHFVLPLSEEDAIRVALNGITTIHTHEQPLDDQQARQLLLAARHASAVPAPALRKRRTPVRSISVTRDPRANAHLGDVLAAYFRLNSEE